MTIAFISHPDCLLHEVDLNHPERPDRIKVIETALKAHTFTHSQWYLAPLATVSQLKFAHDKTYVDWIFSIAPKENIIEIDTDTLMGPDTLASALRAAGAVILAVDLVVQGEANVAFCNIRPPGHHAEREKAMGFCFFNNVAIGVMYAINTYQLKRIAIIDFDVHHGNGTQNIFEQNKQVMYCSSFQYPFYPGYDEELDNEHILSVPLAAGTKGDVFRDEVAHKWFTAIDEFKPELIFFSAGFDAHQNDPLANLELTKEDYVWLTQKIARLAKKHCSGKMISVLEGGYDLAVLADCVPAHVKSMIG